MIPRLVRQVRSPKDYKYLGKTQSTVTTVLWLEREGNKRRQICLYEGSMLRSVIDR